MRKIFFVIVLLLPGIIYAQKSTISGYVKDAETGEALIGASIYDLKSKSGTASNEYGFYSLTLPQDSVNIRVSYIGYQTMDYNLKLEENMELTITLNSTIELETVVVSATKPEIERSQMSAIHIPMKKVQALPVLMGEQDIIKTIQLFPGVQSGSEGSSGLYVRGGGADQNLILLDGVPIYNANHLFGFFSIFNADAINNATIIKGGFPAHYGGRLSSVLDIRMKEGNMKKISGEGSVGLLSSKFALEGPIIKDKTSFIISARRTYIDILARPFLDILNAEGGKGGKGDEKKSSERGSDGKDDGGYNDGNTNNGGYYFWDLNAKINHVFSSKSRLYLSGYMGRDRFYNTSETSFSSNSEEHQQNIDNNLKWGNAIGALRWNKIFGSKLFMNVTGTYSRYQFRTGFDQLFSVTYNDTVNSNRLFSQYDSGIEDVAGKVDFYYAPNTNHSIRFGMGNTYHTFIPGVNLQQVAINDSTTVDSTYGSSHLYSHEHFIYVEDDWDITGILKVNLGVHFSGFLAGDTWYNDLQPRISARLLLSPKSALKASYSKMTQYLHLLTNPTIGLPTDLWVPATERIAPEYSNQVAIGYSQSLKRGFQFSIEAYYKDMTNLIDYREGSSFVGSTQDWQDLVIIGEGYSYGGEFLLEKKRGKTTGWIGYTLSWTNRQFDELNFGEEFPYVYDRRHDIGVAITHKIDEEIDIGVVWVFGSGYATTLAQQTYSSMDGLTVGSTVDFIPIEHIESRNDYRMPSYHRLDLGINFHKKKKHFTRTWSFGLYNTYSRQNPFYLYFDYDYNGNRGLYQLSLFPVLPSVSYKIKF